MPPYGIHELLLEEEAKRGGLARRKVDQKWQSALLRSVRDGDLERVRYICSVQEDKVDLCRRDDYDSTPLYYAALCGHTSIVVQLLNSGARADERTFDGERAYYAALTDEIRKVLRDEGFKRQIASGHDPFLHALSLLNVARERDVSDQLTGEDLFADLVVRPAGDGGSDAATPSLRCHSFVLKARLPTLSRFLHSRKTREESAKDTKAAVVVPAAYFPCLAAIVDYVYTNRLAVPADLCEATAEVLCKCKCPTGTLLRSKIAEWSEEEDRSGQQIILEPPSGETRAHMQVAFAPYAMFSWCRTPGQNQKAEHYDVLLTNDAGDSFACHRAVLCVRSDYFKTLFTSTSFRKTGDCEGIHRLDMGSMKSRTLEILIHWLYSVSHITHGYHPLMTIILTFVLFLIEFVSPLKDDLIDAGEEEDEEEAGGDVNQILEVLVCADQLLCENLKTACAAHIIAQGAVVKETCVELLQYAFACQCQRLQNECLRIVSANLLEEAVHANPLLSTLIRESASEVKMRQDVDTIDLVDDIRWFLQNEAAEDGTNSERVQEKLDILDALLAKLNLQA